MINKLYDTSLYLADHNKYEGCLLIQLCLIDALAKKHYPNETNNQTRYCNYLKQRLNDIGIDEGYRVEEKNNILHLSEIIYNYFRCYLVHEANSNNEVYIEFNQPDIINRVEMDLGAKKLIIGCLRLIEVLSKIISEDIFFKK